MNKASGGDGIPAELFQVLKDGAVKVLCSICQQIWKTQQWPQDWKMSVFIPIPKKGNVKAWDSPGKNTGVGCHFLLQGIFLTQGLNPGLPHCRQTRYRLSREESGREQLFAKLDNGYLVPLSWRKGLVLGIWFCKSVVFGRR